MPRLSILIAHRQDKRLEETLLSVLENRPADSEIIVAHDGSYADPYQLDDEVLFVETSGGASRTSKLNDAIFAACAPVLHVLGEGVCVTKDWCESPVNKILRQQSVAVTPLVRTRGDSPKTFAGLDLRSLAVRGLLPVQHATHTNCAGPLLEAGFFARKTILALGGFLDNVDSRVADVDMALCMQDMHLACEIAMDSCVLADYSVIQSPRDARIAHDLASLMAAHQQVSCGVAAGLKGAAVRILANCVNPSQWAPAIAWGMGLTTNRLQSQVQERLNSWSRANASANGLNTFRGSVVEPSTRRAA